MLKNILFFSKQKKVNVFFAFFLGIILYNFIVVKNFSVFKVDCITYTYHIVDFSIGLCSKLLPGAIFSFLFKEVMPWHVTLVETVLLFISFAVISFFITELIFRQENKENQKTIILFSLFFITGPVTFSIFTQELGILDVYWLYFSLFFFFVISKKYLYFLIPVIYILSVSIHFSSVISYILLFSIIILYRIAKEKNERTLLIFVLIFSVAAAAALTVFFMKNESENLNYDLEGFHNFIDSRCKMEDEQYYIYYDYSLYKVPYTKDFPYESMDKALLIQNSRIIPDFLCGIINSFWQQILIVLYAYRQIPKNIINLIHLLTLIFPAFLFFNRFWLNKIHEAGKTDKFMAFSYFLMLIQLPFTALIGCLCSPDFVRWFAHAFLIQFAFVFYVIFSDGEGSVKWIANYFSKYNNKILFLYFAVYSITTFPTY